MRGFVCCWSICPSVGLSVCCSICEHELKSGKRSVLHAFCVCVWWGPGGEGRLRATSATILWHHVTCFGVVAVQSCAACNFRIVQCTILDFRNVQLCTCAMHNCELALHTTKDSHNTQLQTPVTPDLGNMQLQTGVTCNCRLA